MAKSICSIADCERDARRRGWCPAHYSRWKRHGAPWAGAPDRRRPTPKVAPPERICSVVDCATVHFGLGLCHTHYNRRRSAQWRRDNPTRSVPDLLNEQWRSIPGHGGAYEASDLGRVRSVDRRRVGKDGVARHYRGRLLKQTMQECGGHLVVTLPDSQWLVHRIVLKTFVSECPPGLEGCHNDGDPSNNWLDNLRWDTHYSNMQDVQRHRDYHRRECDWGHALRRPNLVACWLHDGYRICLACNRARSCGWYAASRGHLFDFHAVVARKYAEIMGVEIDGGCPNGGRVAS